MLQIRKGSASVQKALVDQFNRLRDAMVGSNVHASVTAGAASGDPPAATALAVTAAVASNLATSLTLVNNIKAVLNLHFADTYAHKSAVSAAITTDDATDLDTAVALGNELKAAYNTHRSEANVHHTNDGGNAIAATDATDQSSLNTLLNEMRTDVTAHIALGLAGQHIQLIDA